MNNYYEVLKGRMPENKNEAVLLVLEDNRITETTKEVLGIKNDDVSFDEVLNSNFKIVLNNDLFTNFNNYFIMNEVNEKLYNNENNITVNIVGILRMKKEHKNMMSRSGSGIFVTRELQQYVLDNALKSDIVKKQKEVNYNVLTGEMLDTSSKSGMLVKNAFLSALGGRNIPVLIYIYPNIVKLDDDYLSCIDQSLGFTYLDDYFLALKPIMKNHTNACRLLNIEDPQNNRDIREKKLEYFANNFINIGNVNGSFERAQLYKYLNDTFLNKREKRYTKIFIEDGLTPSPYISYTILRRDGNITYHEEKTSSGYVLRKKN